MNDLINQHLAELDAAWQSMTEALLAAQDAHNAAIVEARTAYAEAANASKTKLSTAMNARFLAWNGEMEIDASKLPRVAQIEVLHPETTGLSA